MGLINKERHTVVVAGNLCVSEVAAKIRALCEENNMELHGDIYNSVFLQNRDKSEDYIEI